VVDPQPAQVLANQIGEGDRVFEKLLRSTPLAEARTARFQKAISNAEGVAIVGLANRYLSHPWPVPFLLIVDPLVSWLWIGALVIAFGGLIAIWPGLPPLARRRSTATYSARLRRELA
jgi:cytochrome c-type biogenesis protein CcmF